MTNKENHLGGTYLKPGHIKAGQHVQVTIEGRKGGPRILPATTNERGSFGPQLEIPISIEGQEFVLALPSDKGDGKTLDTVFGPCGEAWIGKRLDVYESTVLDRMRVQPIG